MTPPCLVLPWDLQCAQATGGRVRGAVYVRAGPSMGTLRSMPEHPGADAVSEAPDRPAAHESCAVVWDDAFTEYDFGRFHPMAPVRLTLTRDLARASGLLDRPGVEVHVRAGPSMGTLRSMPEHPGADAVSEAPDRPAAHESCAVVWDDAFTEYDFGRFHPMAPVRLTLTRDLARASGLLDRPGVEV